jgi:hypothetical protein
MGDYKNLYHKNLYLSKRRAVLIGCQFSTAHHSTNDQDCFHQKLHASSWWYLESSGQSPPCELQRPAVLSTYLSLLKNIFKNLRNMSHHFLPRKIIFEK